MINETKLWLETSSKINWNEMEHQVPFLDEVLPKGNSIIGKTHLEYCKNIDFKLYGEDQERLQKYSKAINYVQALGQSSTKIQITDFIAVQRLLLGNKAELRTTVAYCFKNGTLAFYPKKRNIEALLRQRIHFVNQLKAHSFIKATLIYLDIIFIHPFKDGNARAARIWADFFLCPYALDNVWIPRIISFHKDPKNPKMPLHFIQALMRSIKVTDRGAFA